MHDQNGKALVVNDDVFCYAYRMGTVVGPCKLSANSVRIEFNGDVKSVPSTELLKVRSWKDLCQQAVDIQNGSNIVGLAQSFANVTREVKYRMDKDGVRTDAPTINNHPVIVLWSNKFSSLSMSDSAERFSSAYTWACDIIGYNK